MAEHAFAKAQDNKGRLHWLRAETEDEIQDYCDSYHSATKGMQLDLFEDYALAIEAWSSNVTPAMAQSHFTWVGKKTNPYVVAKPIYVKDEENNFLGYREFKEKW